MELTLPFRFPEVVLDKVKRYEVEVSSENWELIMELASAEILENKKIDDMIAKGRARAPE